MPQGRLSLSDLLDRLESFYGPQEPHFPTDPFEFLGWWYSGYPASAAACAKGWEKLNADVGIKPGELLRAKPTKLTAALKPGGMFPELRAERIKEAAMRIESEFGGDLRTALSGPLPQARKILKTFHSIADPGTDRILLFAGIAPIAAVPSNCVHVLARILNGKEGKNYSADYREGQRFIAAELPDKLGSRTRAYLLLKRHGQELCKAKPKCPDCPLRTKCAYAALN